jgi:regulator of replication initiation timing
MENQMDNTQEKHTPTIDDLQLQISMNIRQIKILATQISNMSVYNSELEVKNEVLSQVLQQREMELANIIAKHAEGPTENSGPKEMF